MAPGESREILLEKTIRVRESYGPEAPEGLQKQGKIFTTAPKTRRHPKTSISGNRLRAWMMELWEKRLRSCSYETLRWEFIRHFETNDKRVIEKYIGRPEQIVRSSGSTLVRLNRNSGSVAQFDYHNKRRLEARRGLGQLLGYMSMDENGKVTLHHERLPYYTEQTTLLDPHPPLIPPSRVFGERAGERDRYSRDEQVREPSIDNLCVYPIGSQGTNPDQSERIGRDREEREVIESTHKSSQAEPYLHNILLTPEELKALNSARGEGPG